LTACWVTTEDVGVAPREVPEPRVPGVPPIPLIRADRQGVDVEGEILVVVRLRQIVPLDNHERLPVIWAASAEGLQSCYQAAGRLLP
jgi:hypothetical protein